MEERARAYVMAGVKPVFVFDGRRLPGKTCTDQARAERRLAAQALIDAELDGTTDLTQLRVAISAGAELPISIEPRTLKAAVAVNDAMNTAVLQALRAKGYTYIKAPYEADAQLACLDRLDMTQYTETVDSDLLVYGVRRVAIRARSRPGHARLFRLSRWTELTVANKEVKLLQLVRKWGTEVMPLFAVLAGCDMVHMRGFGPAVALAIMQGTANCSVAEIRACQTRTGRRPMTGMTLRSRRPPQPLPRSWPQRYLQPVISPWMETTCE